MSVTPIKPLEAASATATNGSAVIVVSGNVDCSYVYSGTVVVLGTRKMVEAISGTKPDGSGNSTITLRSNWTQPTTTDSLFAFNTIEGLNEAIRRIREAVLNITAIESLVGSGLVERSGPGAYSVVPVTAAGKAVLAAANAAAQLTAIGAQAANTKLTNFAALAAAADKLPYFTGASAMALADLTTYARSLLAAQNAAAVNTLLGVQTKADLDLLNNIFARMTLDLNFVEGVYKEHKGKHLYQLPLLEAISCARSTTATEPGPLGINTFDIGEPRLGYNPSNGERVGLITEPNSTNLITYSNDYTNAVWGKFDVTVTPDAQIAPDGTLTAARLTKTAAAYACIRQIIPLVVSGSRYTFSFYARPVGADNIVAFSVTDSASNLISRAYVDLFTGVVTNSFGSGTPRAVRGVGGWWRIEVSAVAVDAGFRCFIYPGLHIEAAVRSIDVWGAQFELGEVTSLIPTTNAALQRAGDNIRSVKTNYAQRRALLYFEGVVVSSGPSTDVDGLICVNSNTASNFMHISYNKQTGKVLASLPPLATLRDDPYVIGQPIKAAVYYDANTGKIVGALNGNVTEATTTIPDSFWNSLQFMNIGSYYLITNRLSNSETKRVCYSNASFTAAELALLTK